MYLQPRSARPRVVSRQHSPRLVAGAPGIRQTSFLAHLPEPAARAVDRVERAILVELKSGSEMGGVQASGWFQLLDREESGFVESSVVMYVDRVSIFGTNANDVARNCWRGVNYHSSQPTATLILRKGHIEKRNGWDRMDCTHVVAENFLELGKSALQAVDEWRLKHFSAVPIDHHPIYFYIRIRLSLK